MATPSRRPSLAAANLVVEAGTGTGKTFAYLVPAIQSGQRVILSTGTKALQDQLFHRDLPRVHKALGVSVKTALLKGRANYVCWYRLDKAKHEGQFPNRAMVAELNVVLDFAARARSPAIWANAVGSPDDAMILPA
ncbi:MAG: DEAD/DEAH box helicase [Xanthomonadales bacterium]|nr:DEAD/DEAH box helicase [Xanthomonadales bacterium]